MARYGHSREAAGRHHDGLDIQWEIIPPGVGQNFVAVRENLPESTIEIASPRLWMTPDELRSQAMHALSSRITSLYWFNLSLKSLLKFPDTSEPMTGIGREIRMLEPLMLQGDGYDFEQISKADGTPDWDLASIVSPDAAVLFANDTAYVPDPAESVFKFGPPRPVEFSFRLPPWLRKPVEVFRMDADGIHEVSWSCRH